MATNFSFISELAEKASRKIASNPREWKAFLKAAAQIYKYPFTDQLLIYAQRPEATACASITIWNSRMNRWVNRGSKGIALIDTSRGKPRLKYVFDVKDTHEGKNSLYPQMWKLSYTNRDAVMDMLKKAYGKANSNLALQLISIAEMSVGANYSEYLDDLMMSKEKSFLEDLDELNTEVLFRNTLTASVKYVVLTRCGFNADKYISEEYLKSITNFNTEQTLSYVGNACSKISAPILRQIERQVKISDRKIKPKAIENQKEREYNKFSALKRNPLEEVITNGVNIYEERGLHDSGLEDGPAAGRETRQVRKNEGEIPQGTQERDIHVISPERQTLGTPSGNRPDSEQPHEADYGSDGKKAEHRRETETVRPNALGSGDEQHTGAGRGNNRERDNIQLSFFPTVEEQIEQINSAEDEQPSAFSIPQQDITRALCEGSGFEGDKFLINGWFEGQHGNADTVKFLKNEYGTGEQAFTLSDGTSGSLWFNAKGFFLSHDMDTVNPEIKLTWKNVAERLHDLVLSGRYLTKDEQSQYANIKPKPEMEQVFNSEQSDDKNEVSAKENTPPQSVDLTKAQELITQFISKEYGGSPDFTELYHVPLAYTTTEDEKHTVSVEANLIENSINYYFDNKLVHSDGYPNIEDLNANELSCLDFDTLINSCIDTAEKNPLKHSNKKEVKNSKESKLQLKDFHITDDNLGAGGQKTKYGFNINAIRTLIQIESESRTATPEEQETLSKYVGWGGCYF